MSKFAYIRVSTRDQNEDRQIIAISDLHIPEKTSTSTINQEKTSTVQPTGAWFAE